MPFLEEYTLLDELGQGGYATVYKVRHNQLGYIRAIRVLNAIIARGETDQTYKKFLDECRMLLRLGNGNHPNIVHIYQPLLKEQRAIVEMDYVDGKNLYHYIKDKQAFIEIRDVLNLLTEIGSALAYCHEDIYKFCMDKEADELQDDPNDGSKVLLDDKTRERLIDKYHVIHNDIHSGNIIRRENGSYVLLDFGLAIEGDSVVRSSRRKNGAPEFKAPEKWENDSILTTQSDIYSFGVVLYEFLAGRVPFLFDKEKRNSVEAEFLLGEAHKKQQPPPIFELRKAVFEASHPGETYEKDYPDWLETLIMKCLAKRTEDRFKNGKELYQFVLEHKDEETNLKTKKLQNEIAQLKEKIAKLEQALNDQKKCDNCNVVAELDKKLQDSIKRNGLLIAELERQLEKIHELEEELKEEKNSDHIYTGPDINETLFKDVEKLQNALAKAEAEVASWEKKFRLLEKKNEENKKKLSTLEKPTKKTWIWKSLTCILLCLLLSWSAYTVFFVYDKKSGPNIEQYTSEIKQLKLELLSAKDAQNNINNDIDKLKTRNAELEMMNTALETINEGLKTKNQEISNDTVAKLKKQILSQVSEISTLESNNRQLNREISSLKSNKNADAQKTIDSQNKTIKKLNTEKASLEKKVKDKDKLIKALHRQLGIEE